MSIHLRKTSRLLLASNYFTTIHSRQCIRLLSSSNTRLNKNDNNPENNPVNDNSNDDKSGQGISNDSYKNSGVTPYYSGASHEIKPSFDPNFQRTLNQAKHYLEKMQGDIKPMFTPYITRMNNAKKQIKRLTTEDSREAVKRLGEALNEITGYNQIDAVKTKVKNQGKIK